MISTQDRNLRIQLSLAATMFFAPFVQSLIKKDHLEISDEDRKFVDGYIRLGQIAIGVLLLTIAGALMMYFFASVVFLWIYRLSAIMLIVLLVGGTIGAMANIKLLQEDETLLHYNKIQNDKSDIFLSFFPIYNIYQRYKLHNFEHPYRWAKESILWWTLFTIVIVATKSAVGSGFILTMIVIRVASLLSGIDVLDEQVKKKINNFFFKNPEELRGYVRGTVLFWIEKISGDKNADISKLIEQEKVVMQRLLKPGSKILVPQYVIGIGLLVAWYAIGGVVRDSRVYLAPMIIIFARYFIMFVKRRHLPNLPVAKEIIDIIRGIYQKVLTKKAIKN